MAELRVTELDFTQIKQNIKTYLQAQTEFADYDFTGSGLSIFLDVLAYNTHYNAMIAHLQANEQFIDTAIKRASVVSIAKTLNYTPRTATASRAIVTLTVVPNSSYLSNSLVLIAGTNFTATIDGRTYTFNVETTRTAVRTNGEFVFPEVTLIEGQYLANTFTVAADTTMGPFVIPVKNIDESTMAVTVQDNSSVLNSGTYTRADTIIGLTNTSKVYWLEENPFGQYQIVFGDGIIGLPLTTNSVVTVEYLICNGPNANGASIFSLAGTIGGLTNVNIALVSKSSTGSFRETIDEIRFNAPKFNTTQNRVVTAQDYKYLIQNKFPRAKSVAVWGGEENIPPIYGKVFITVDAIDGDIITEADKDYITNVILRPRAVMSIQHEFIDADYLYAGFKIDIRYNPKLTTFTPTDIEALVASAVETYFTENLRTLDRTFFYSQFIDAIQDVLPTAIVGVLAKMTLQRRLEPTLAVKYSKTEQFLTSVVPRSIYSTVFVATLNDVDYTAIIRDDGEGNLLLIDYETDEELTASLGSIDYATGIFSIIDLLAASPSGASTAGIRIHAEPDDLSMNISPKIVPTTLPGIVAILPGPARNTIIELDNSAVDTVIGLKGGLTITAIPYLETN